MTLVASLALLSACGGGGGGGDLNPSPTPTPTPVPAPGSVNGRVTFVRIPFGSNTRDGLNYANPQNRPARGVTVRALAAGTTTELARAVTDDDGDYALNVTAGTNVTIEVVAEMVKTASSPRWDFTVRDLPPPPDPTDPDPPPFPNPLPATYTYSDGTQFAASGATHDVLIPSGLSATGAAAGTRASAPFAILDTIYQAVQLVLSAKADVDFPALVADWGIDNAPEDGTYFTAADVQHIVLTADLTADTDEFDQHVIAHEFGHYIEYNFSRADNIGGTHGIGDKLDPRVAFGEGFGYAFGAMVLNDPITRDSFVSNLYGCPNNQCSSSFNVNTNPPATSAGDDFGCWCSESSVWSLLWDVFDNDGEAGDPVTLGFKPIWDVLVGPQKITPAFTTIFSFITALKDLNAGSATAINTLVAAQNINGNTIDAYGSTETNFPTRFIDSEVFPIYATATVGGSPVTLRSVDTAGPTADDTSGNKLSDRRFIRFMGTGGTVTVTATSTSPLATRDVDFIVYRSTPFGFVRSGQDGPAASESETFATAATSEYLIDVYDCGNGCDTAEGPHGDYDITVTITSP